MEDTELDRLVFKRIVVVYNSNRMVQRDNIAVVCIQQFVSCAIWKCFIYNSLSFSRSYRDCRVCQLSPVDSFGYTDMVFVIRIADLYMDCDSVPGDGLLMLRVYQPDDLSGSCHRQCGRCVIKLSYRPGQYHKHVTLLAKSSGRDSTH